MKKIRMKKTYLGTLFALLAIACAVIWFAAAPAVSPIVIPAQAIVYTDEAAMEMFLDEGQWAMPDLLQSAAYLLGDEMNIDFWFSKKADDHQINNARSFAIINFVLQQPYGIGTSPYRGLIADKDVTWKTVSCKVYRGRELLYHERYDEHYQLIK